MSQVFILVLGDDLGEHLEVYPERDGYDEVGHEYEKFKGVKHLQNPLPAISAH